VATCSGSGSNGRDPDLVRVLAVICSGLVILGAPLSLPVAPSGSHWVITHPGPNASHHQQFTK
jgi:hypothetical protein